MGTLNQYCIRPQVAAEPGKFLRMAGENSGAAAFWERDYPADVRRLTVEGTPEEISELRSIYESIGPAGSVSYTPPGAAEDSRYRIVAFIRTIHTPLIATVDLTLENILTLSRA